MKLSIVVPVLNEVAQVRLLLDNLARQEGVEFELVFSDGGSIDGTLQLLQNQSAAAGLVVRLVQGDAGRGAQLNRGGDAAAGDILLFLHVDSRFEDPLALKRSLDALAAEKVRFPDRPVAGHFRLRFDDAPASVLRALRYWEIKARLHRSGCNHGDQGLLIGKEDFCRLGGYPNLRLFEDTLLAEQVKREGRLFLLPAEVITSARRFAAEGLRQRHTLNAILMTCLQAGLTEYFERARGHYRQQRDAGTLTLTPFLETLEDILDELSPERRRRIWREAAGFVRTQCWQLLLAWRVRQGRWTVASDPQEIERVLEGFDRIFNCLTDNPVGHFAARFLLRLWLQKQKRDWRRLDRAASSH